MKKYQKLSNVERKTGRINVLDILEMMHVNIFKKIF